MPCLISTGEHGPFSGVSFPIEDSADSQVTMVVSKLSHDLMLSIDDIHNLD